MASAGTVTVDFTAETAAFTSELRKVNEHVKEFDSSLARIGEAAKIAFEAFAIAEVTAQIGEAIERSLEFGKSIELASQKAGAAAGAFSELNFAAKLSGVGIDDLTTAFKFFQVNLASGGEKIQALGVDLSVLRSLKPDEQFQLIAEAVAEITDPAEKAAAAVSVFGRSGANLLPLLNEGSEGIQKFRDEAIRTGAALSDSQVEALGEATKSVEKLQLAYEGLVASITAKVAPNVTALADLITRGLAPQTEFDKLSKQLDSLVTQRNEVANTLRNDQKAQASLSFLVSDESIKLAKSRLSELDKLIDGLKAKEAALYNSRPKDPAAGVGIAEIDLKTLPKRVKVPRIPGEMTDAELTASAIKGIEDGNAKAFNELGRLTDESLQKSLDAEKKKSDNLFKEIDKRTEAEQRLAAFKEEQDRRDVQLKFDAADQIVSSLGVIANGEKKFAALRKAVVIAETIRNTAAGVTRALDYPYPLNLIAAATTAAAGAVQIGIATSTPDIGGGGSSFNSSIGSSSAAATIGTQATVTAPQLVAQAAPAVTQIIINGDFIDTPGAGNKFIDIIREQLGNDVLMIPRDSAQAQMFTPAQ